MLRQTLVVLDLLPAQEKEFNLHFLSMPTARIGTAIHSNSYIYVTANRIRYEVVKDSYKDVTIVINLLELYEAVSTLL